MSPLQSKEETGGKGTMLMDNVITCLLFFSLLLGCLDNSNFVSLFQIMAWIRLDGGMRRFLTRTWIQAADSDGIWLTVQTEANGVVSGVAKSLPLLRPITTRH